MVNPVLTLSRGCQGYIQTVSEALIQRQHDKVSFLWPSMCDDFTAILRKLPVSLLYTECHEYALIANSFMIKIFYNK